MHPFRRTVTIGFLIGGALAGLIKYGWYRDEQRRQGLKQGSLIDDSTDDQLSSDSQAVSFTEPGAA